MLEINDVEMYVGLYSILLHCNSMPFDSVMLRVKYVLNGEPCPVFDVDHPPLGIPRFLFSSTVASNDSLEMLSCL